MSAKHWSMAIPHAVSSSVKGPLPSSISPHISDTSLYEFWLPIKAVKKSSVACVHAATAGCFKRLDDTGGPSAEVMKGHEGQKLLRVVERWLRDERDRQKQEEVADPGAKYRRAGAISEKKPIMPSKHMAFYR